MAATETATNCWTKAQDKTMTALSQSASFRQIVEAADAAAALLLIFGQRVTRPANGVEYTDDELKAFSFAQVFSAAENGYSWINDGAGWLKESGTLVIYIDRRVTDYTVNTDDEPLTVERWIENRIGTMLTEVHDYLETNSGPYIKTAQVTQGPAFNPVEEREVMGLRQRVEIVVEWGY